MQRNGCLPVASCRTPRLVQTPRALAGCVSRPMPSRQGVLSDWRSTQQPAIEDAYTRETKHAVFDVRPAAPPSSGKLPKSPAAARPLTQARRCCSFAALAHPPIPQTPATWSSRCSMLLTVMLNHDARSCYPHPGVREAWHASRHEGLSSRPAAVPCLHRQPRQQRLQRLRTADSAAGQLSAADLPPESGRAYEEPIQVFPRIRERDPYRY